MGLLVLAALVFRMSFCAATPGLGRSPQHGYREQITLATRLLTQGTLGNGLTPDDPAPRPTAVFPPLYPALIAGVYAALGIETAAATAALQILNALSTSLLAVVVFGIAIRIGGAPRAAWLAAGITAAHPILAAYTSKIWDVSVFSLAVAGAVWLALWLSTRRPSGWAAVGYGAYLGCVALLNPALTPAYPLLVLWMLTRARPRQTPTRSIAGVLLCLLGWAVVLTPWTIRNLRQLDMWTYVRCGFWQEVWLGVCPEADDGLQPALAAHFPLKNDEVRAELASRGERAFFEDREARARQAIAADPVRYLRLCARRVVDYWMGTVLSQKGGGHELLPQAASRRAAVVWLALETAAFLAGLAWAWRRSPDLRWLGAIVLVFCVLYICTHVEIRYRVPMEGLMMTVAVCAASMVMRRTRPGPPLKVAAEVGARG